MNFTANSRRAAVLSLFSLVVVATPGCMTTDRAVSTAALSAGNEVPSDVASMGPVQSALTSTRAILERGQEGIGLEISEGPGVNQIAIETSVANPNYKIDRLSNPPRLVIDLPSERVRLNQNIPVSDLEYIAGVRVGTHPDKSRVVLDLTDGQGVIDEATTTDGKIVVTLRGTSDDALRASMKPSSATQGNNAAPSSASPQERDILAAAEQDLIDSAPSDTGPVNPSLEIADNQDIGATVADNEPTGIEAAAVGIPSAKVVDVKLEKGAGSANMVVVDVEGTPEYSISKSAPSEYVLTVRNSALSSDAQNAALVAPPESTGIRSVRTTVDGSDALVRIFAQPETYLTARMDGTQLVVEETQDLAQVAEDIRAQLEPKDGEKSEPAPAKPAEAEKKPAAANPKVEEVEAKGEPNAPKVTIGAENTSLSEGDVGALLDESARYTGRLISLDLQDTDIDNALRIIAEVSNLNIVASDDVTGKVTLRLIDVPWDQALDVILKTNGLDKVLEGNVMRIAPVEKLRLEREALKQAQQAEEELEPLTVRYLRVSYAKASELRTLVETVLSERGSVAFDERSNQLIVKDVRKGLRNVIELVNKIDLRTPQVLLETQIVEANRTLARELGAELGFQFIQSPSTGNGTGLNFPAAIGIGGSASPGTANSITGSAFPVASRDIGGSAITFLFDSADGTKTLELRLSQLEQEGRVRIVSRPAVATTNNKAAEIKSVERFRVKLPNGGLSVATGSGASASGSSSVATEIIEAGIILNVTPQASPDYFVLLDIKAKSSTFGSKDVDGIPNEIERAASSTVLVSSGQTFALGGIYKITDQDRISGVPFFKDVPFFGHFFRRMITDNADEELLFFITPRIVEGSFDDASMRAAS